MSTIAAARRRTTCRSATVKLNSPRSCPTCRKTLLLFLSSHPAHPRSRSLPAAIYGIPTSPHRVDFTHSRFCPGRRLAGPECPLARRLDQRPHHGRPMDHRGLLLLHSGPSYRLLALAPAVGRPRCSSSILARL